MFQYLHCIIFTYYQENYSNVRIKFCVKLQLCLTISSPNLIEIMFKNSVSTANSMYLTKIRSLMLLREIVTVHC